MIKVPRSLLAQDINGYSDSAQAKKTAFHKDGKAFLRKIAKELGLTEFDLRSNVAGIAVSGEVTLHSDMLYLQLHESCMSRGIQLLFRSCDSRKDFSGHTNNYVTMDELARDDTQEGAAALSRIRRVLEAEQEKRRVLEARAIAA